MPLRALFYLQLTLRITTCAPETEIGERTLRTEWSTRFTDKCTEFHRCRGPGAVIIGRNQLPSEFSFPIIWCRCRLRYAKPTTGIEATNVDIKNYLRCIECKRPNSRCGVLTYPWKFPEIFRRLRYLSIVVTENRLGTFMQALGSTWIAQSPPFSERIT